MNGIRRLCSSGICLLLLHAHAAAARTEVPTDIPKGHWALPAVGRCIRAGLLPGGEDFGGSTQVSRFEMARWTAALLDRFSKVTGPVETLVLPLPPKELDDMVIDVKESIAALEEASTTLKEDVAELHDGMEVGNGQAPSSLRLHGLLGVGWIVESSGVAGRTRYEGFDGKHFDVSRMALGVDAEPAEGLQFHLQLDHDSSWQDHTGRDWINEVYFDVEDFLGLGRARLGAYALPFSREHLGPLRSCRYTVTPSTLSTMVERIRSRGFHVTGQKRPGALTWRAGLSSGTDDFAPAYAYLFSVDDRARSIETAEADGGMGHWLQVERPLPTRRMGSRLAWQLALFDNGGDTAPGGSLTPSTETDFFLWGLEYAHGKVRFLWQSADGTSRRSATEFRDWESTYILLNWKLRGRSSVTGRYERWDNVDETGQTQDSGGEKTLCFNRVLGSGQGNGLLQFEFIKPKPGGWQKDLHLNQFQARYTMWF